MPPETPLYVEILNSLESMHTCLLLIVASSSWLLTLRLVQYAHVSSIVLCGSIALPVAIGALSAIEGQVDSLEYMGCNGISASYFPYAIRMSLIGFFTSFTLTLPSYFLATIVLSVRALRGT